jgi:hypothetical protein
MSIIVKLTVLVEFNHYTVDSYHKDYKGKFPFVNLFKLLTCFVFT